MARKKSHLTLKLGPAKQREIFFNVLLKRYLSETGKEFFTSDEEKEDVERHIGYIWDTELKNRTNEFASLSARELEEMFEQIEVGFDEEDTENVGEQPDELDQIEQAATAIIMNIPLQEAGFKTSKIRFDKDDPLELLSEPELLQVRWAYDVAIRIARYAYEDDKEVRKYLRKEIHGLLSAYIPKEKIIPVRDLMIEEYKEGLLFL